MSRRATFAFRLYIAGDAHNSVQAVGNLSRFCRKYLPGRHQIEIVDVFRDPRRALTDGIFMTPALVKLAPWPSCRIIGTLSEAHILLQALELDGSVA